MKYNMFCELQLTGVPVESKARSQSNLIMHPTSGFSNIDKFSNMTIPMFWAEYVRTIILLVIRSRIRVRVQFSDLTHKK